MALALPSDIPTFDADGALSREFLLHRGYCCENGCRNCPYGFLKPSFHHGDTESTEAHGEMRRGMAPSTAPRRIVSLCPSNTEILAALGLMDRVVGVDDWTDWPAEARSLPRVGPDLRVNMDRVEALEPDLVLASLSVPGMEWNVQALRRRGLPHLVLDAQSLDEIWDSIRLVARVTGTEARGEEVVRGLQTRIRAVQDGVPPRPPVRLYWEWWPRPLFSPGRQNWLTPISELAGGVNITSAVDAGAARPSPAEIAAADPEVILLAWTGVAAHKVRPEVLLRRPGWDRITAVRTGRVHVVEEGLFCRPGPRLVDGLEYLAQLLWGGP